MSKAQSIAARAAHARPAVKERHRAAVKAAHARPETKAKHRAAVRAALKRPETIALKRAIAIEIGARPEVKRRRREVAEDRARNDPRHKAHVAKLCEAQATPEGRQKCRERALKLHSDPDFKKRHRAAVKAGIRKAREARALQRMQSNQG